MTRFRRLRWIAITAVAATAAGALVAGAGGFADRSALRCATPITATAVRGQSWRTEGFRAVGCHAWRRVHHHHLRLVRSRP